MVTTVLHQAGKSIIWYWLMQVLRQRGIQYYVLQANADGEGNWYHGSNPALASTLVAERVSEWPPTFVQSIRQAMENCCLPFLVDMGSRPRPSHECLLQSCIHVILLLHEDPPEEFRRWEQLIEKYYLLPLARIVSCREGESAITATSPILEGVISKLERYAALIGAGEDPFFVAIYAQIEKIWTIYDVQQVIAHRLASSPNESRWQPDMLPQELARLPEGRPLSVYGIGLDWLYAALAAYENSHTFYLFGSKFPFGRIEPMAITLSANSDSQEYIGIILTCTLAACLLKIRFPAALGLPAGRAAVLPKCALASRSDHRWPGLLPAPDQLGLALQAGRPILNCHILSAAWSRRHELLFQRISPARRPRPPPSGLAYLRG